MSEEMLVEVFLLNTTKMTKKGWIIVGSIALIGLGVGTYFLVKAKNKKKEEESKDSDA